jgi:uncharacterized protein YyaL (SSP411 family)
MALLFPGIAYCSVSPVNEASRDSHMQQSSRHTSEASKYTNALIDATSPYLLQHAHNPVNWFPFSEEAIARARNENKPVFLSVGYSACHWCHVMEKESFENEEIAEILNKHFISIKVDREERPDIDRIYMTAIQVMTGSGGWPMSVFLTPELKPFFGGTYFPPESRYGRPGFKDITARIAELWKTSRDRIDRDAGKMSDILSKIVLQTATAADTISTTAFSTAAQHLERSFDSTWGGFSAAPKFPPTGQLRFLLRQFRQTRNQVLRDMAVLTLDRMAYGGMYDQVGGGFHRYSVDEQWLVPHFEKMLYDNALLAWTYLEAYQVTSNPEYRRIVTEILDYVLRGMTAPEGGFYSSEDADSEGEEGKFYTWSQEEITGILSKKDAQLFNQYYGITEKGNFEGRSIPHVPMPPAAFAKKHNLSLKDLQEKLDSMRTRLRAERDGRIPPGKDDKVITAWNGLMISAFARAYQVLGDERYRMAAERATAFIMGNLYRDGILYRTWRKGNTAIPGYLDDYACMLLALTDLYQADFNPQWLEYAHALAEILDRDFREKKTGTYLYTASVHSNLIVRFRPSYDESTPSGNAIAADAFLKLGILTGRETCIRNAVTLLKYFQQEITESPVAYSSMLCAMDFLLDTPAEIAIAGPAENPRTREMLAAVHTRFIPNKVVALTDPSDEHLAKAAEGMPLLAGKTHQDGKPAVYICRDFQCKAPVTETKELENILDALSGIPVTH